MSGLDHERERMQRFLAEEAEPELAPATDGAGCMGRQIGRYVALREVGRGGMGVVLEAEDMDLHRRVALKVLHEGASPAYLARLHREARIVAQLQHSNIVPVHEIGRCQDETGRVLDFLAMGFVDGSTLSDLVAQRTERPRLVAIVEQVARAAAHAHANGVVHRDLKAANVMVDKAGRVMLMDFGIARAESEDTELTRGMLVGTPQYMAPEQADPSRGPVGPWTDIYALGAMLYEALTGRAPFSGASAADICRRIVTDEPPSPRSCDRTIAPDLDLICATAMRKDPRDRYHGAQDFADDLSRFMGGGAIRARAPSLGYRLRKSLARHRVALAVATAFAATVAAAGLIVASRVRAENAALGGKRAALDRLVARMRDRSNACLAASLEVRRAGHLALLPGLVRMADDDCAEVLKEQPGLAEPHYVRGRLRRALMEFDAALAEQDLALAKDPRFAPALYERVVLTAREYRRRDAELQRGAWSEVGAVHADLNLARWSGAGSGRDEAATDVPLQRLRTRLERDLAALEGAALGAGEAACVRGLRAWLARDVDAARRHLADAVESGAAEEAIEALATIEAERGDWAKSIELWTRGLESDRGYVPHLEGRAHTRLRSAQASFTPREFTRQSVEAAVADFTRALELRAGREEALLGRASAHVLMARLIVALEPPAPVLRQAVADYDAVLAKRPDAYEPLVGRAIAYLIWTEARSMRRADAETPLRAGIACAEKAAALHPKREEPCVWRALLELSETAGRPATPEAVHPHYEAALRHFEEALRRNPSSGLALLMRGRAHHHYGAMLLKHGIDGSAYIDAAIVDLEGAAKEPRMRRPAASLLATACQLRGAAEETAGGNPEPHYERARRAIDALEPDWDASLLHLRLAVIQASVLFRTKHGGDGRPLWEEGLRTFDRLLAFEPNRAQNLTGRGSLRLTLAQVRQRAGEPSIEFYRGAREDLEQAIRLDASLSAELAPALALCRRELGE